MKVHLALSEGAYLFPPPHEPECTSQMLGMEGPDSNNQGFGALGFVANCGLARFSGPCPDDGVRAYP